MKQYKETLKVEGCDVISYTTKVGLINYQAGTLKVLGHWSRTTTKHLNYVAQELKLKQV